MLNPPLVDALVTFEKQENRLPVEGHAVRVLLGLGNHLPEGEPSLQRLNLTQLGRELNLQRDVVREALKRLMESGVIEVETRKEGRPTNFVKFSDRFLAVLQKENNEW